MEKAPDADLLREMIGFAAERADGVGGGRYDRHGYGEKSPLRVAEKALSATWQRCRAHFMRNVLARAGKSGRRVVSAFIATAFAQETPRGGQPAVAC